MKSRPRRDFLKTLAAVSTAAMMPQVSLPRQSRAEAGGRRPNVVMIVSDDQGFGDLGCYGNPIVQTPQLDSLSRQSVRLNQFIVSPLCAPTRAAVMTGRYDYRVGVWDTYGGRAMLRDGEVTLPMVLAEAGYQTGFFGKWHLGGNYPSRPGDKGFGFVCPYGGPKFNPRFNVNGTRQQFRGFYEDALFDVALGWIEENRERPFFAYVASKLPHDAPLPMAPEEYVAPYRGVAGLGDGDAEVYGMMSKLDENVGRVLQKIRDLGLEEDTIVVFFPDNGPLRQTPDLKTPYELSVCAEYGITDRYSMGLRAGKTSVYEGGIRVPCFMRWPGVLEPEREIDRLAAHIDIFPTLLDLCGISPPEEPRCDGLSLAPLLRGEAEDWPEREIAIQSDRVPVPRPWHNACVRGERYKLVNGDELYDIRSDPGETEDIAGDHPEVAARMRGVYDRWYSEVSAENDGFAPSYAIVGSERQSVFSFGLTGRHPQGWRLKLACRGEGKFTVQGIQGDLFAGDGAFALSVAGVQYRKTFAAGQRQVVFDSVPLTAGDTYFDIAVEGLGAKRKFRRIFDDLAFRRVRLEFTPGAG